MLASQMPIHGYAYAEVGHTIAWDLQIGSLISDAVLDPFRAV